MSVTVPYREFLATKHVAAVDIGFDPGELHSALFGFQEWIVRFALRKGKCAIFADTGLGKTMMQLEWAKKVAEYADGKVLILVPLAVAGQTVREAAKIDTSAIYCRSQAEATAATEKIIVANYDMLDVFDPAKFVGVVLDESSILKNFTGATKRQIISAFDGTPYKLACTATPAPNDHLELGNHAEFLSVMSSAEMTARWFVNDLSVSGGASMGAGAWRLKKHAEEDFWRWVCSWAVCLSRPSDLGFSDDGFILPPLNMVQHTVAAPDATETGVLFHAGTVSATELWRENKKTAEARADLVASLVGETKEPWVLWCHTDYEAEALTSRIPGSVEVRGSMHPTIKEKLLSAFSDGEYKVIVTKPSIAGFGLNWQHCANMAFVGLSYSYESLYQAVRRSWRYGQTKPVTVHLVCSESEGSVLTAIERKEKQHRKMTAALVASMKKYQGRMDREELVALKNPELHQGEGWSLYLGDCVESARMISDNSVHLSVFSPPFANLYIYSDSAADMGNSAGPDEFFKHYDYAARELLRITVPGRICCVHARELPRRKYIEGVTGTYDFPGDVIRSMENAGWVFHSRITIWKDPVTEMQRTKSHGLLYKTLRADSSGSRQGMADYILVFRKWDGGEFDQPVTHTKDSFPLDQWQEWASPVWFNVRQSNTLNVAMAKDEQDEKHICPLQLDVIERCIHLWSNPGDLVYDPFAGIGSTGYVALRTGRRFLGSELKDSYHTSARKYLAQAITENSQLSLEMVE